MSRRRKVFWVLLVIAALVVTVMSLRPFAHRDGKGYQLALCRTQMRAFQNAISVYQAELKAFPAGNLSEIIQQLQGANPKQIDFLELPANAFDARRDWVDPWRTPYALVVSPIAGMKISSAGPNRKFGDDDDLEVSLKNPAGERQ